MRILKFIGAFLGTLLVVLVIVFGYNPDALVTLYKNSEDLQEGQEWVSKATSLKGLTEYISAHPEKVALVSRSATNPDTAIRYGAETPHTMGTLSNFFLIATYARFVENSRINPDTLVALSDIDRYQLPYIDATNHKNAVQALKNQGVVSERNRVALKHLVRECIIFNDLAISDWLLHTLGLTAVRETYNQLKIGHTDLPLPFSGLYIALQPSLAGATFEQRMNELQRWPDEAFRDTVFALSARYLSEPEFREKVERVFSEEQGLGIGFTERRDALRFFPKSTAEELSELMIRLQQGRLISSAVSQRVRRIMNWPFKRQSLNNDFHYYGAIYDHRLGLLNGMDYGASTYSGEPFGQAAFFDSLQVAFWFHMSSNLMHQDYQQRLIWDPALRETTVQEIRK